MSRKEINTIAIIGAGNVGTHLALALDQAGCSVMQIAGRHEKAIRDLAETVNAQTVTSLSELKKGLDLYILALPEAAMEEILPQLDLGEELLVHTSGSLPLEMLFPYTENNGVFYPLQTFTHGREVDFHDVPVLIEANRIDNESLLLSLARRLSSQVQTANSVQRKALHLAAVFACNFSNHMYSIARQLANEHDIDYDLLKPLIRETALKAISLGPQEAQTGPAKRNDLKSIDEHMEMLSNNPGLKELYKRITESIQEQSDNDYDEL